MPVLSLDALSTAWLSRRPTVLGALPGLNHDLGSIQAEADIAAIKHPVFPPYSGGNELTAVTLIDGRQLSQYGRPVQLRWRAYALERRARAGDWRLESRTTLLPGAPGCLVTIDITNTASARRRLDLAFLLSARARNTGVEDYNWSVPSIPTDVFNFRNTRHLQQTAFDPGVPGALGLTNEDGNAHSVQGAWPAPDDWRNERTPHWNRSVGAGKTFRVSLLFSFSADRDEARAIARTWWTRDDDAFTAQRAWWEARWLAAFTPDNAEFSGHLPTLTSSNEAATRLYYNGVLTLLTCRRRYRSLDGTPHHLTLWPRRGEGTVYLGWDLGYTSGLLARLDPAALRCDWRMIAETPPLAYQMTNLFENRHTGWPCSAHFQATYTSALNLVRWSGDRSWLDDTIDRQLTDQEKKDGVAPRTLTGREVFSDAVFAHRRHHLPRKALVDFGAREAYLEAITTYAHGTAGHTALQAWALREAAPLLGKSCTAEAARLERAVLSLAHGNAGYFDCLYPDGRRFPAANLYDIGLVLNHLGPRTPRRQVAAIIRFVRRELLTPTWAHNLAPSDLDALSGTRCDHQWAGSFPAWIPQFVLGLLKAAPTGEAWLGEWLDGVTKVTRQGPFAQAYWTEDSHPAEAGAAAKCHDELTQGNHWVISSGAFFSEMILDGICGLHAGLDGTLTVKPGYAPWAREITLENITCQGKSYRFTQGRLHRA